MDINPANKSSQGPSSPSATLRRLPGKARPQTEALREYQEFNSRLRDRIPAPLWAFFAPDPEEFYRWRIQLSCDCIKEVLTKGPDDPGRAEAGVPERRQDLHLLRRVQRHRRRLQQ
ncbi:hypothetical protein ACFYYL_43150, partial [Actinomadura geliboluensis]|uniref:hypothetical protein n=1 Tax=Actinomadura geliboluensis TaxID=882440 RepID=UPI0036C7B042